MTREEFFNDKSQAALWDVAVSINRTNPLPIDKNAVFASYTEANTYVTSNPVAYPGQVLAVVAEDKTTIYYTCYNEDGTALQLVEIGGGAALNADDKSIEIIDNTIQIKNFGDHYYHYIEATEEIPAHYERAEGFIGGLEPRVQKVTTDDGDIFSIEWYEPSSETIEGVAARLANAEANITTLEEKLDNMKIVIGTHEDAAFAGFKVEFATDLDDISENPD